MASRTQRSKRFVGSYAPSDGASDSEESLDDAPSDIASNSDESFNEDYVVASVPDSAEKPPAKKRRVTKSVAKKPAPVEEKRTSKGNYSNKRNLLVDRSNGKTASRRTVVASNIDIVKLINRKAK